MICLKCNVDCVKLSGDCYQCYPCVIQYNKYNNISSIHFWSPTMGFDDITQYCNNIDSKSVLTIHFNHKKYNVSYSNSFTFKELYDFYLNFIENLEFI